MQSVRETPVIEVVNLRKTFGSVVAVEDVSFEVVRGEIFGILGPNGAGKSTTVEAMTGLRSIDGGRVCVLGLDPHRQGPDVRELVGTQLQEAKLPSRLRVGEALELYAAFYQRPADPADLMSRLGLSKHSSKAFADLSGGQQQRLSIALALVGNPQIAVLDELTTGLDPNARRATWELVRDIRDTGVTVVLVTHYMEEAEHLCDRVAIVRAGRVVAVGPPADVAGPGVESYLIRLPDGVEPDIIAAGFSEVARHDDGRMEVTGGPAALTRALNRLAELGVRPTSVQTRSRNLGDAYTELTHQDL
ncbi:ABC transporter ATP-binding protein [Phycicoccus sp. MAQZ13P-2]|nr:ABC transporter ATP-binding protein [Phycicoccus mangrovi]